MILPTTLVLPYALELAQGEPSLGIRAFDLSDELAESEQAEVMSAVIGRRVEVVRPEKSAGDAPNEEQAAAIRFFDDEAYTAEIAAVRKIHPGLRHLEQYLRENGWNLLTVLPMPGGDGSSGG